MKSPAMEVGQYNITANALIPGLVDTALTRYDKRLSESIGETGRKAPDHPFRRSLGCAGSNRAA